MALVVAVAAIAVLTAMLWSIMRAIMRSPDTLRFYLRMRRGMRGYHAVSQGLIAVGSGDVRAARKFADEAARIAPNEPLTLLLTRAGVATVGRPRRGRAHLQRHGGARRHAAARAARALHRGAAPQRRRRRQALRRGGRRRRARAGLGGARGVRRALRRRRLGRRAGAARPQHEERAGRPRRLPAPARGAADRARARSRRP